MIDFSYTIYIALIPFFIFIINGLFGHKMIGKLAGYLGVVGIMITTYLSYITAFNYFFKVGRSVEETYDQIVGFNIEWLRFSDTLHIDLGILLDPISVMMLVVISTISLMVHIYSLGYMEGDKGFARFYAFLSLFTFSMLGLVLATNIFQMYIFWELVGISSYLLIAHYYNKPSAVSASKKAFIITRFADLGFLIGILILSFLTGTFDFNILTDPSGPAFKQSSSAVFLGLSTMTWALILIFVGGAGKSAMFPFHIWLPDAMEGPTPVSALIHAATMVVAGVFLVARLFPIFAIVTPTALEIVAIIGGFSSILAAIIACTQIDIKRILAFSTMSQIGYMMLALGVSGYGGTSGLGFMASMFHLFTHAMFKALLFLGAGAIIHAIHTNNLTEMGSLRKYMPITHITFLVACLAISGIPPFAGFFSKDEILVAAYNYNQIYFWVEWIVAGLTAFYMFRLYFSVFWGKEKQYEKKPNEAPFSMTFPLIFLAVASATVGFIPFSNFVTSDGLPFDIHMHWNIALPSVGIAILGIIIAFIFYKKESSLSKKSAKSFGLFYKYSLNKFYFDEMYLFVTKKVIFKRFSSPIAWFDRHIVDATMDGVATITNYIALKIKGLQSGQLQQYASVFIGGVLLLSILFIYVILR